MPQRDWLLDLVVLAITLLGIAVYCWGADKEAAYAVVFVAEDCPPCHKMMRDFAGSKLPVRFEDKPAELDRFHIRSTPTTIIVSGGKPVFRKSGIISPKGMKALLATYDE